MATLILAVTKTTNPQGTVDTTDRTIVVASDKFVVLPLSDNTRSLVLVNGFQFEVDAEVAELATAMSAVDASSYT